MEWVGEGKLHFPLLKSAKHQKSPSTEQSVSHNFVPYWKPDLIIFFFNSLMVVFYVKDKVSKARDGYEVAGLLKEKIGNEEGFFEFGLLKVEPYSKYLYSLQDKCYFPRFSGERRAPDTRQRKALFFLRNPRLACLALLARFPLAFAHVKNVKKITPFM